MFDRTVYFDEVRASLFSGHLTQDNVDGQEAILTRWETAPPSDDLRHLAYCLATTKHETETMMPVEEYGKGEGKDYGKKDPETGQTYYGRGYVQLTWRDNYRRATKELELEGGDDLEWNAVRALDPIIAAEVLIIGMMEGWFRTATDGKPETLGKYFNAERDDPYQAREIVNGDKTVIPSWSGGVSIGHLIAEYHRHFLAALLMASLLPEPDAEPVTITITIDAPPNVVVNIVRS